VHVHELAVTRDVLRLSLDAAHRAGGGTVTGIHLVIGDLASVVDDCVQFYWDILSKGTSAEAARLHFRRVPIRFECRACHTRFGHGDQPWSCRACGSNDVHVVAGNEFRLEAIDLEDSG
jgi:hydrogenase nickel incorporation protein HypA/HybF